MARLVDCTNFLVLGAIPFLRSVLEDLDPEIIGLKWIVCGTLFLYSVNFIISVHPWPGPYYLWKNKEKMKQNPGSLETLVQVREIVTPLIEEGDVVFAERPEVFLGLPVRFVKGIEQPRLNFIYWNKFPPQMYSKLKIISEKDLVKEIRNGNIKLAVLRDDDRYYRNKLLLVALEKYFDIAKKYNSYIIYQVKPVYKVD